MNSTRLAKRTALLLSGLLLPAFGGCLPDDYFALSVRNVAVAFADSLLGVAVNPTLASFQDALDATAPADTTDPDDSADAADTGG